VAGALALLLVATTVFVAIATRKPTTADAATIAGPQPELTRYILAVRAVDEALPVEAHGALDGLGKAAQQGTLDIDARREKIKSLREKVTARRAGFAALPIPAGAESLGALELDLFDKYLELEDTVLDQLRLHEEVAGLVERKRAITTREEATSLQDDFRTLQERVTTTMKKADRLESEGNALGARRDQEIDRLIKEHALVLPAQAKPREQPKPRDGEESDEALARDPFCASQLQMGATLEDCRAARRP
jgi:cell fate (sporulation/competence/biofilm development) regulator YlbF (YheA/YmcA/DUF963 family)